jgi:hypothetical protein
VREQVAEHEADVPFVVYDEYSARASIDDGIGHDPPRLAVDVTTINPRVRRSRCGDPRDLARGPAPGVASALASRFDPHRQRSRTRRRSRDRIPPVEFHIVDGCGFVDGSRKPRRLRGTGD